MIVGCDSGCQVIFSGKFSEKLFLVGIYYLVDCLIGTQFWWKLNDKWNVRDEFSITQDKRMASESEETTHF